MPVRDVATTYIRWTCTRAALARGWWLVTSLYLVVDAGLSPFELVFIGTAQAATGLLFEVPTGVMADTIGRKASIVVAHLLMGAGMAITGIVTEFPALLATQMLWGLAWTFSSGADVAWLTDEMQAPAHTAGVLTASARSEQIGSAAGIVGFGALAWATSLAVAIVVAGLAMLALGVLVAVRFPERHFTPARTRRWREDASIFQRGIALARGDREILLVFAAAVLVNGASDAFERLHAKRLVELGLPQAPDPIVWLTALGLVTLLFAAIALRIVEARIDGAGVAQRLYAAACAAGVLGLVLVAIAPDVGTAMAGVLLVGGIAWNVTRCVGVIWVNRRVPSEVRATAQSFLAQAEYAGEIALGLALGVLAQASGIAVAMAGAALLVAGAGVLVARSRDARLTAS